MSDSTLPVGTPPLELSPKFVVSTCTHGVVELFPFPSEETAQKCFQAVSGCASLGAVLHSRLPTGRWVTLTSNFLGNYGCPIEEYRLNAA